MERDEIRARIAKISTELTDLNTNAKEKIAELNILFALLEDDEDDGRPKLRLIKGGLGAVTVPAVALGRRTRHLIGAGIAASMAGAVTLALTLPAPNPPDSHGIATSSISSKAPPTPTLTPTNAEPVDSPPTFPGARIVQVHATYAPPSTSGTAPTSVAAPSPTATTPNATLAPGSTATPSKHPTNSQNDCYVTASMGSIVGVCVP